MSRTMPEFIPSPSRGDTEDNLTSITDANSNQTAFTYDAFGRVTRTNFPSSLSEYYQILRRATSIARTRTTPTTT